jgi:hypothetical protein
VEESVDPLIINVGEDSDSEVDMKALNPLVNKTYVCIIAYLFALCLWTHHYQLNVFRTSNIQSHHCMKHRREGGSIVYLASQTSWN